MLGVGQILLVLVSVAMFFTLGYAWGITEWPARLLIFGIGVVAIINYRRLRTKHENFLAIGESGKVIAVGVMNGHAAGRHLEQVVVLRWRGNYIGLSKDDYGYGPRPKPGQFLRRGAEEYTLHDKDPDLAES